MPKSTSLLNTIFINRDHLRMAPAIVTVVQILWKFLFASSHSPEVGGLLVLEWLDHCLPQEVIQLSKWADLLLSSTQGFHL